MFFSFLGIQISLSFWWQLLYFCCTINGIFNIGSSVKFCKLHLEVWSQLVNLVINWSYLLFQWVWYIKFYKKCSIETRKIVILIFIIKEIYGIIFPNYASNIIVNNKQVPFQIFRAFFTNFAMHSKYSAAVSYSDWFCEDSTYTGEFKYSCAKSFIPRYLNFPINLIYL